MDDELLTTLSHVNRVRESNNKTYDIKHDSKEFNLINYKTNYDMKRQIINVTIKELNFLLD